MYMYVYRYCDAKQHIRYTYSVDNRWFLGRHTEQVWVCCPPLGGGVQSHTGRGKERGRWRGRIDSRGKNLECHWSQLPGLTQSVLLSI